MSTMVERPHVVIAGAGFAGLYAARSLKTAPVRVTIVDRQNHHLFQPLLYQVATAGLSAPDIATPIRAILRQQANATVLLAEIECVNPNHRCLVLDGGELVYDFLILATGSSSNYFGHCEWAQHATSLKSVEDAFEIRHRVLLAFEAAERERDTDEQRALLTFAIVGAGPTGAELAGVLREIAQHTLARDFRNFDPGSTRVVLIDAADRVLPSFPEPLSQKARVMLEALGVEVQTSSRVVDMDALSLTLASTTSLATAPQKISTRTILWAAGVTASPLGENLNAPRDEWGRVYVEPDLSVPGYPELFVVGDLAHVDRVGQPVPAMAPPAIQEGRHAANMIQAELRGDPRTSFHYKDRGMLASIGRRAGLASIFGRNFSGLIAWLLWLLVHITSLIGFRNRLVVLFEWSWAYFTYQRSARVILRKIR
ncbi:MAG TPA: FAD-dependent oxidoreductase [Gammaproteobacteria bacterium]|jgi:NADH dehydrogenase|nr:MAG: NAD(P)/FAD-dependent oxidoreductase [Gammaproteobacteria bacterium]HBK75469.1 FAD-dependent oxidoreductase [Gammaproteobacteria bacterium]HIM88857.1 NAD(P)/FAD-dependent oxidoreductase [Gammaproteobacteria bacterium]